MNLQGYIEYRKAELKAEGERVSQPQAGGISAGRAIEYTRRAEIVLLVLSELERALKWEATGEPEFVVPLTAEERDFWTRAVARGVKVPGEIREQL